MSVCIINTGGTIGMGPGPGGYRPIPGFLQEQLNGIIELQDPTMPEFEVIEFDPVIDSSNMTPGDWQRIAHTIFDRYEQHDGFVVLHGTDTMAYTASALAFMLEGLAKPVILTGSQLPLCEVRNDARENLLTSLILAANDTIAEVCIFFADRLLRGCRATKVSSTQFHAFDSPNAPPLGSAGTRLEVYQDRIRSANGAAALTVRQIRPVEMSTFRLFPGFNVEVLQNLLRRPLKALVLESYGDGNGPTNMPDFVQSIQAACREGTVIVNCSQCHHGGVTQSHYETGRVLAQAGVVSGADMTIEAALAKLMFLFSNYDDVDQIKAMVGEDLRGELTVRR